ncbi:MBL fold metallo-hydrolase [Euryarchaeota archaeon ex4484_178]|nr:MAG: MBL fold metallo-hydrolase [Euryarchaeota archaeon ex4484_178]
MVSFLKLTVINDNEPGEGLKNDWGWSVLLESDRWRILFDADTQPEVIEHNEKVMRLELRSIDYGFLSHYHADHYGGFEYIGRVAENLKVFVPPGPSKILKKWNLNVIEVRHPGKLMEDVWSTGPMGFIGEQALGIKVDSIGLVVIVGCSHPGVDSLTEKLQNISEEEVYMVIGGFHSPSRRVLDNLAKLTKYIYPAHCTGISGKMYVKRKYPEKYREVKTGSIIKIGKEL